MNYGGSPLAPSLTNPANELVWLWRTHSLRSRSCVDVGSSPSHPLTEIVQLPLLLHCIPSIAITDLLGGQTLGGEAGQLVLQGPLKTRVSWHVWGSPFEHTNTFVLSLAKNTCWPARHVPRLGHSATEDNCIWSAVLDGPTAIGCHVGRCSRDFLKLSSRGPFQLAFGNPLPQGSLFYRRNT